MPKTISLRFSSKRRGTKRGDIELVLKLQLKDNFDNESYILQTVNAKVMPLFASEPF